MRTEQEIREEIKKLEPYSMDWMNSKSGYGAMVARKTLSWVLEKCPDGALSDFLKLMEKFNV